MWEALRNEARGQRDVVSLAVYIELSLALLRSIDRFELPKQKSAVWIRGPKIVD